MGEDKTFETFFKTHFERFYYYALHLLSDEEGSRDVVFDALEYVWHNFSDRDADQWFTYTVSYIRNKCIDQIRHQAVHQKYAEFYIHAVERTEEQTCEEEEMRLAAIRRVMESLPPRTRLVLQECYIHKKKYREVADELEISTSAVKKHIVKALKLLRENLAERGALKDI